MPNLNIFSSKNGGIITILWCFKKILIKNSPSKLGNFTTKTKHSTELTKFSFFPTGPTLTFAIQLIFSSQMHSTNLIILFFILLHFLHLVLVLIHCSLSLSLSSLMLCCWLATCLNLGLLFHFSEHHLSRPILEKGEFIGRQGSSKLDVKTKFYFCATLLSE